MPQSVTKEIQIGIRVKAQYDRSKTLILHLLRHYRHQYSKAKALKRLIFKRKKGFANLSLTLF
jgi:hypothetical protein